MPRWETEYFCAAVQVVSETSPYEGVRTNQPAASNTKPQIILMKAKSLPLLARKSRKKKEKKKKSTSLERKKKKKVGEGGGGGGPRGGGGGPQTHRGYSRRI